MSGKKQSKEHIEKRRKKMLGHKVSEETREKISNGNKGKIISEETKKKMSVSKKGKPTWNKGKKLSKDHREKLSKSHEGYIMPAEPKRKIGESMKGEKHHNWKGGKTKRLLNRHSWKLIRQQVLIKYDFKCQDCGKESNLCVHHVIPYREVREDKIENLIPLCRSCHIKEEGKIENGR